MSKQSRSLIVVNKYYECDPVCCVLTAMYRNEKCNIKLPWPQLVNYLSYGPVRTQPPTPRLIYVSETVQVEVWCISDLLSKFKDTQQSSSQCKMDVLSEIFTYSSLPVDLVVAVGTASSGPSWPTIQGHQQDNINGSVIVGSKIFMHDGHPKSDPNPVSKWRCKYFNHLMSSSLPETSVMKNLSADDVEAALLCTPTNPGTNGRHVYVSFNYVAIDNINVSNPIEYPIKDKEAGDSFNQNCPSNANGVSLETTHGLIYAAARIHFQGDPPFMFVSGVVDRYTKFGDDVAGGSKNYAQNIAGAHNAGVVVAQLIAGLLQES